MTFVGGWIFLLMGLILAVVLGGLGYLARRTTNSDVLRRGLTAEAQVIAKVLIYGAFLL